MKKNLLFVCSAVLMLALTSCGGKTGGNTEAEAPQDEVMPELKAPTWEKFVNVIQDEVKLYKAAEVNSPKRTVCYEDAESDMVDVVNIWADEECPEGYLQDDLFFYPGEVFPCLGEEGDFYKVALCQFNDNDNGVGYIAKSAVEEVKPEPIADNRTFNLLCSWARMRVFTDGKYKNMVMRTKFNELEGEMINIGKLVDGVVVLPLNYCLPCFDNAEIDSLQFNEAEFEDGMHVETMEYPSSIRYEGEDGYTYLLNLDKLSDAQVDQIYDCIVQGKLDYVEYIYYFPTIEAEYNRFASFFTK